MTNYTFSRIENHLKLKALMKSEGKAMLPNLLKRFCLTPKYGRINEF